MRIAILHEKFSIKGGGERIAIDMAKILKADIYTGYIDKEHTFDLNELKIIEIGVKNNPIKILESLDMLKKFSEYNFPKYDIYIFSGSLTITAVNKCTPNILYLHSLIRPFYSLYEYCMKNYGIIDKLCLYLQKIYWKPKDQNFMKKFDMICANSKNVRNEVLKFYGHGLYNKCNVVYPFIETKKFYNKNSIGFYLSASRLDKLKRIDLLIETFKQMNKNLVITGTGPDENRLKKLAKRCNNIKFVGSVDEERLRYLYSTCFATICASVDEPFGLTPIESHASGKPAICVNEGGFKETIIENVNGLFFEPNVYSLISTINKAEKIKWNVKKIQKTAGKYDIKNFMRTIKIMINKSKMSSVQDI